MAKSNPQPEIPIPEPPVSTVSGRVSVAVGDLRVPPAKSKAAAMPPPSFSARSHGMNGFIESERPKGSLWIRSKPRDRRWQTESGA